MKAPSMQVITNFARNTIYALTAQLEAMPSYTGQHAEVLAVAKAASNAIYGTAQEVSGLIRDPGADGKNELVARQFLDWRANETDPLRPLFQIMEVARRDGAIADDHKLAGAMLMAAFLAAVPSALPFHNHHHTREVVFLASVLGLDAKLSPDELAEIFIAACIHDFAHDGQGNRRLDKYTPMRLESRALVSAEPFLKIAGIDDAAWQRIRVMVLATDVSKGGANDISPAEWLRLAYEGRGADDTCPPELRPLFADKDLARVAGVLEDSDIGTSAAMPYDYARRMTALIAEETRVLSSTPQTLIGFIDHICSGAFITREAQILFGDAMKAIRAQAEAESANTIYHWS